MAEMEELTLLVRGDVKFELDDISTALYQIPLPKKVEHQDLVTTLPSPVGMTFGQFP
jgi:hypothetical protein